ncbi:MAG: Rieske 2Fe-2S domain-containing protein [Gammaproteobacteria bacterium]|nr:Rieske 2Fe-2S domain-containing protein [Gammaproteobacteria bacterium]
MTDDVSRRKFLSKMVAAIGGFIAAGFGVPAVAYVVAPASNSNLEDAWVSIGSTRQVEMGTPTLFKAQIDRTTGWVTQTEETGVYVSTDNGRDYTALSNVCTHLGCRVRWMEDQQSFLCPCHNGVFSKTGQVLDGPPPKPLESFDIRVEGEQLEVHWDV